MSEYGDLFEVFQQNTPSIKSHFNSNHQHFDGNKLTKYAKKRMMGIEPTSPAWKAGVIAIIRHPLGASHAIHTMTGIITENKINSQ